MAASFVAAGASNSSTAAAAPVYPATVAAGTASILVTENKGTAGPQTPTGYALVTGGGPIGAGLGAAGADAGPVYNAAYFRQCVGTEGGTTLTVNQTSGALGITAQMYIYSKAAGETWSIAAATATDTTTGTSLSFPFGSDPGFQVGDIVLVHAGSNTDLYTYTTPTINIPGCTLSAGTNRRNTNSPQGNDFFTYDQEYTVTAGTSTGNATFTLTSSGSAANNPTGSAVIIRIRAVAAPTGYTMPVSSLTIGYSGKTINLLAGRRLPLDSLSVPYSGKTVNFQKGFGMGVSTVNYPFSGQTVNFSTTRKLTVDSLNVPFTGRTINFYKGRTLAIDTVNYPFSSKTINLLKGYKLPVSFVNYPFSGKTVNFFRGRYIGLSTLSIPFTAQNINFRSGRRIILTTINYPFSGKTVNLIYAPIGSYVLPVSALSIPFTAQTIGLLKGKKIAVDSLSIGYSGKTIAFLFHRKLTIERLIIPYSGKVVNLVYGTPQSYSLTISRLVIPFGGGVISFVAPAIVVILPSPITEILFLNSSMAADFNLKSDITESLTLKSYIHD